MIRSQGSPADPNDTSLSPSLSGTWMVPIRVQVTTVESRVSVVLIEGLPLPEVDPWVVLAQPVAILHPSLPGHVHQLGVTATFIYIYS